VVHVPIPTAAVPATAVYWLPFVERIAKRSRNSVAELVCMAECGDMLLHLAWDAETKTPLALACTRIFLRAGQPVWEYMYHWGPRRELWEHLFSDLEKFHKDALGCVAVNVWAPKFKSKRAPDWIAWLEKRGYRATHVIMEKDL